ncbi:MAG: Gfo/Idh/MocA family oxidoreductase [Verrucomicrobiales bacterium]|nr:Gfo/Idh/MocA family oxidoreductase [Verrucomicrobiales bacterium]
MIPSRTSTSRRRFLRRTFAIGTAAAGSSCSWFGQPLEEVRVGICGFHGKGMHHIRDLLGRRGVRIVALCDVDGRVMDEGLKVLGDRGYKPTAYKDYRKFVEDKELDGVIIATPNHSHTLIAMTAMAAGKHVYVEKPVCHNIAEGRLLVDAAHRHPELIVTHGLQLRSDEGRDEAFAWVKEGHLGPMTLSRGLNYKARESIGKLSAPDRINSRIDYDLWCACRPVVPVMRDKFHYDWHWQWPYGNGDIGNQGPHQLDVARWAIDQPRLPPRMMSLGNRWGYVDDGQTPNNQLAFFDYDPVPILFDNRGLPLKDMNWKQEPVYQGIRIGNILHCEGGWLAEGRAYDNAGKSVEKFSTSGGSSHMENWLQSIRDGRLASPHLDIAHGHVSASLAHLANISYRIGKTASPDEVRERLQGHALAQQTLQDFQSNLDANGIDMAVEKAVLGPWLEIDPETEAFVGEFAAEANALREETYREGHELPVI